ncbi:MAG TPA: DUF2934 domain-containing protein [Methylovirgula sp.]
MEFEDRIRHRAYEIWEREGHPEGHALDHWTRALSEETALNAKPKKAMLRTNSKPRSPRANPPAAHKARASEVILN